MGKIIYGGGMIVWFLIIGALSLMGWLDGFGLPRLFVFLGLLIVGWALIVFIIAPFLISWLENRNKIR